MVEVAVVVGVRWWKKDGGETNIYISAFAMAGCDKRGDDMAKIL